MRIKWTSGQLKIMTSAALHVAERSVWRHRHSVTVCEHDEKTRWGETFTRVYHAMIRGAGLEAPQQNGTCVCYHSGVELAYNMWVRVSQVKPSNCFRLHPTSMISKHSTVPFLTACRRLEKLVLPSIFDTSLSSLTLMTWNLQSYPTTVSNEIMWTF